MVDPVDEPEQELFQPVRPIRVGQYELHHKLGSGGMASVYLGRQVGHGGFERWVAVKRIHEHLAENAAFRSMFVDEARLSASLNHPNVVQVTDVGTDGDLPFMVMEYVNGETFSQLLKRCVVLSRPLSRPLAARIVAWACDGLHHAHELKGPGGRSLDLVHRDVSPQNILVSYDGAVKLTDFGIAKAVGRFTHTRTGYFKGKIGYLSPEQALAKPLDRRSDIFVMGTVLWEASLSRRLFRGESELKILQRIASGDVPAPRSLAPEYPGELERIVMKAVQVRPEERYQTARDLQVDLESFLAELGRPVGSVEIAELMRTVFEDRFQSRSSMLTMAPGKDAELELLETPMATSTSVSIDPLEPTKDLRHLSTKNPSGWTRSPFLVGGVLLVAIALGAGLLFGLGPGNQPAGARGVDAPRPDLSGVTGIPPAPEAGAEAPTPLVPEAGADPAREAPPGPDAATEPGPSTANEPAPPPPLPRRYRPRPHVTETSERNGAISVITDPWCEVYLGSRRLGRTPIMRTELPAGRHVLRLCPLGREPCRNRAVRVVAGEMTPVSVELGP